MNWLFHQVRRVGRLRYIYSQTKQEQLSKVSNNMIHPIIRREISSLSLSLNTFNGNSDSPARQRILDTEQVSFTPASEDEVPVAIPTYSPNTKDRVKLLKSMLQGECLFSLRIIGNKTKINKQKPNFKYTFYYTSWIIFLL